MANYSVSSFVTGPKPVAEVISDLHNQIESIDNTKVIRLLTVVPVSRDRDLVIGVLVYDT